ncbi:hypothetical protein BVRB_4g081300 [Beta vulgaris subsp. vulgaris]|nr:hypothetical protein BVRB_4g081300 [Beta vulgaris subsp. vulgaris]
MHSRNSDTQDFPEFFKVYLPEHNSNQLVIPPDFVKNFEGKTMTKVILKNMQGEGWKVELEKAECKLLMTKGWESFVIDNSLARGEFLIFTYEGSGVFFVKIFSTNGCEKDESTAIVDQPYAKLKQEANLDKNYSCHAGACEKTYSERCMEVKQVSEDSCELKNIRFKKVHDAKPYHLHIPAGIFSEYNIKPPLVNFPEIILLRDQRGVSQEVKVYKTKDRRVLLTSGWRNFQLESKLVKGEAYEYEIILGEGRKIKEIVLLNRPTKTVTQGRHTLLRLRSR